MLQSIRDPARWPCDQSDALILWQDLIGAIRAAVVDDQDFVFGRAFLQCGRYGTAEPWTPISNRNQPGSCRDWGGRHLGRDILSGMAPGNDQVGTFRGALGVSLDLPLASLASRGVAQAIDLLCILVAWFFALIVATLANVLQQESQWVLAGAVIFSFLLIWGYFAAFEILLEGRTPGKWLLGLRVVSEEGATVEPMAVLLRNLLRWVDLLPGAYSIGVISIFLDSRSRRVGDLVAGTVVIRQRDRRVPVRLVPGLAADDVALIEIWLLRAPLLLPDHRVRLAALLLEDLAARYPDAVGSLGSSPEDDIQRFFCRDLAAQSPNREG